jgi:hypothetical protein
VTPPEDFSDVLSVIYNTCLREGKCAWMCVLMCE